MKLYNVDWKDPQGNLWKDCVIEPALEQMRKNPKVDIIREGFRTEV